MKFLDYLFPKEQVKKEPIEIPVYHVDTQAGLDPRFYTNDKTLTIDDKRKLVNLTSLEGFRVFEKYLDWRINISAHNMKANLLVGKNIEAAVEASEIDALVKVTQDMANFYTEVKTTESVDDILVKENLKDMPKVFGEDKYNIEVNFVQDTEQ